ncbi:MAG: D-glucuronyl C5-epimerase family protein [Thermodesulfobacteriota bacterium]
MRGERRPLRLGARVNRFMCGGHAISSVAQRLRYWRRILDAYLLHKGSSNLSFWHTDLAWNTLTDEDRQSVRRYPMNFSAKTAYRGPRDAQGVIMLDYKGSLGLKYNPNAIAQLALGWYDLHLDALAEGNGTLAARFGEAFLAQAGWFLTHGREVSDGVHLWEYEFPFEFREPLIAPWRSALAQGQAISVLIRAYGLTREEEYGHKARLGFNAFRCEASAHPGGVLCRDEEGTWLEETILSRPNHILNGFVWALWGVRDYAVWSGDPFAGRLYHEAEQTLARRLDVYDVGFWTCYDDSRKTGPPIMPASPYYQRLHVVQMQAMYELTHNDVYLQTHRKWLAYADNLLYRLIAFLWKCWFKVRYW